MVCVIPLVLGDKHLLDLMSIYASEYVCPSLPNQLINYKLLTYFF